MDTSQQYRKMCKEAEEIQQGKRELGLVHGDVYYEPTTRQWDIIYDKHRCYRYGLLTCIWLPRQEDLQEMVGGSNFEVLDKFFGWREFDAPIELVKEGSMEQLWLAFVMKEKYNKVWNGEKWVPIE